MKVLIEGLGPDAIALARLLASEGDEVRLAAGPVGGEGRETPAALDLRELDVAVEPDADLDSDPGPADVAYLDVWTPATAPRVQRLQAQGSRVSCLGDLLLQRWEGPTIGITGTAGKTSTTHLTAEILRCAGIDVAVSCGARAGNLWPTGDLLAALGPAATASRVLLLELTSSHLAFMQHSPGLAAVISFWPDHLELHGGLERYRAAKETIVRHQRPGDVVVVNADDASAGFASVTPARRVEVSLRRRVERGAFLEPALGVVLVEAGGETGLGHIEGSSVHPANVLAAAAIASAAGAPASAVAQAVESAATPHWRAEPCGELAGVPVIDDGMAATPAKTAALLSRQPGRSVVLVAGGLAEAGGGPVHSAPEESEILDRACDEVARAARVVVVFGAAGPRLARLLRRRGVEVDEVTDLGDAVTAAARLAPGAGAVIFSPLFPVALADRERFAELVARSG
jgi:UDP-N-acetylmuramoylalanine--D-glutamate ligase